MSPSNGQGTVNSAPMIHAPHGPLAGYAFPPAMLRRAAQEHGWGPAFTECVAQEYRRFLILAATAGHPVTPSRAVDALWHEHLTFTRDYWERLTPLLPAPLHHEPATGEAGDTDFAAQYRRTLDSYARVFGEVAPVDVWPDPAVRDTGTAPARIAGGARVSALLLAVLAGGAAWLTFLSTHVGGLIGLGVFLVTLILCATAQAGSAGTPRREPESVWSWLSVDLGSFSWFSSDSSSDDSSSGSSGSDGGSSCGSSCGGGCSS
ncbi:hypothetical protein GCM10008961_05090 [Deinococcus knuensis]|uniref:TIGR04222 domain-containing membrane protein n=2 Tax=Deinococcus knuensis TaxID=1837380 RepID=A0ABQ2SBG5_9DEIO|nr:hypothetical protein GCM10008961_05090 [Deinococcus knuensis]